MKNADPVQPTRISARLGPVHAAKLELLRRSMDLPISDLLKRGIDLLFEAEQRGRLKPLEVFEAAGFIGSAEGSSELSQRYKKDLADLLKAKHGDR